MNGRLVCHHAICLAHKWGHDLVTSGHLLCALDALGFARSFKKRPTDCLSAFFLQILPPDDPTRADSQVIASPSFFTFFTSYGKLDKNCDHLVEQMILSLLDHEHPNTAIAILKKSGIDPRKIVTEIKQRRNEQMSKLIYRGFSVDTNNVKTEYGHEEKKEQPIKVEAADALRKLASELPRLRRLSAIEYVFTHRMTEEKEEEFMKVNSEVAESEAKRLRKIACELEGVGWGNIIDFTQKVFGLPKTVFEGKEEDGLAKWNDGNLGAISTDEVSKEDEKDSDSTEQSCPLGHDKLADPCRYLWCSCRCERCIAQCKEGGH